MNGDPIYTAGSEPGSTISVPYARALAALECGDIDAEHGLLRWGSNYTFLVSVAHEDLQLLAIYKPRGGERPLWDFPDGTLCQRETAAFHTSDALGWRIVPPTVLREGPRGPGSVQVFIDHDPEQHYFTFSGDVGDQLRRMALFDCIANNADRKGGHCLLDAAGHLWGIDHGLTFNAAYKLRTVIWDFAGRPMDAGLLADVERLCSELAAPQSAYRQAMERLLDHSELAALEKRLRRLLEKRTYPLPGSGPNRPWPPV